MIFYLYFQLDKPCLHTADYRQVFCTVIKTLIRRYDRNLYNHTFVMGKEPDFSWTVKFPKRKFSTDHIEFSENIIKLVLSLYDKDINSFGIGLACTSTLNQRFKIGSDVMHLVKCQVAQHQPIVSDSCLFRTVPGAPILLRDYNSRGEVFYTCANPRFSRELYLSICNKLRAAHFPPQMIDTLSLELVRGQECITTYYSTAIKGTHGVLKLSADPDILLYLQQTGIGSFASEGYGMLTLAYQECGVDLKVVK